MTLSRILSVVVTTSLFALLLWLPAPARADGPSLAPAPMDIPAAEITAKVEKLKGHLFFMDSRVFFGRADVKFDGFLLPNGAYATVTCTWTKLMTKEGKNIMRTPTAEEKQQDSYRSGSDSRIYVSTEKANLAYAEGTVQMRIPCKFAMVKFTAAEIDATKMAGDQSVTLKACKANAATLLMQVPNKLVPIVIFRDAAGGRLEVNGWSSSTMGVMCHKNFQVAGTAAQVEVYYPTEFATVTTAVQATAEPDILAFEMENQSPVVKTARYVPESAPLNLAAINLESVKAQTKIAAQQSYAVYGFNTPEIVVKLPAMANTYYATVDFGEPKLIDNNGKAVAYDPDYGGLDPTSYTTEIRFRAKNVEKPAEFARATGTVHIRYPRTMKVVTLDAANNRAGNVTVLFQGPILKVSGLSTLGHPIFLPLEMQPVRAYDATGLPLKKLSYNGNDDVDGIYWEKLAFWGTPTAAKVVIVDSWLTLDIPFDLPPAAKLPNSSMGTKPAGYL